MQYDVVIKAHKKDYHKLKLVVDSLHYLVPQPDRVYIVSQDGFKPSGTLFDDMIITITDDLVTPFIDKKRLSHRPNWNWVNLVSITQSFTKNDMYFDVQADNFFVKRIELFDDHDRPKIFQSVANSVNNDGHRQYFQFSESMFGIEKMSKGYSYIIEFMMYDRTLLKELVKKYESIDACLECAYRNVNQNSYPADQEIFGNMLEKYFPDKYCFVANAPVHLQGIGHNLYASQEVLEEYIRQVKIHRPDVIACSHHTWI